MSQTNYLSESQKNLGRLGRRASRANWVVKGFMTLGGAALTSAAVIMEDGSILPLGASDVLLIFGIISSILGGLFVIFTEESGIDYSISAVEAEARAEKVFDDVETLLSLNKQYEISNERLAKLYIMAGVCRGVLEVAIREKNRDAVSIITTMLNMSKQSASISMGVQTGDDWTISVYVREPMGENGVPCLKCVATIREVDCAPGEARVWDYGEGVAGQALAKRHEEVLPDMASKEAGKALYPKRLRARDVVNYRSLFAAPIILGDTGPAWGVVAASSKRPNHFRHQEDRDKTMPPEQVILALSGAIALAVAIAYNNTPETKSEANSGPQDGSHEHG